MKKITFHCQTITPMFLSGADGTTPELRPPSIKGAMRFWWRAMNGHLPLAELKKEEVKIFGGSYKDENGKEVSMRSKIQLRIDNHAKAEKNLKTSFQKVLVHKKETFTKNAFEPKQSFNIVFTANDEQSELLVKCLFPLVCILGGFGNRARRGMGSLKILDDNFPKSIEGIYELINQIVPKKFILKTSIIETYTTLRYDLPAIKRIEIGEPNIDVLYKINNATHEVKQKFGFNYDEALGSAKPRFASPVFISTFVTNRGVCPIVTTLNIKDGTKRKFDIQNELIKKIV